MDNKKTRISILLVALSLHLVHFGEAQGAVNFLFDDLDFLADDPKQQQVTVDKPKTKKGILEESEMAIGTILNSYHFSSYDYNETHGGLYISMNSWTVGTFMNSVDEQSVMVTYDSKLYGNKSFKINMVAGLANGYERMQYSQSGYLPLLGVSAQWGYLKTVLMPNVLAVGFELPLN